MSPLLEWTPLVLFWFFLIVPKGRKQDTVNVNISFVMLTAEKWSLNPNLSTIIQIGEIKI